ncbi:MAG: hypothetical protein M3R01_06545 [Actinomycetota bacterium]|nr:hypothetical protein [Actinomycetota bacterium]
MPDQVVVTIAYEGVDGEEYVDEFPLDTNLIRQRTYVTSSRAPESQTKEMVKVLRTTIVGRDLAPEVMDRFYARSEGNAFYAEELIAAASTGAARRTSGTGKGCPPPGNPRIDHKIAVLERLRRPPGYAGSCIGCGCPLPSPVRPRQPG